MAYPGAALAVLLLPALAAAGARGDRGAIHGRVRWWEGTTNSWREATVEAVWKRPQFPAFEERSRRVGADADTFCGAEGTIRFRSHWFSPGERARPEELRDTKRKEAARKRLMQLDAEYEVPVRFDDDAVELCVMISKADHRVLGRIRIDRKTGYFAVERPWFNTGNNSIPWAEIRTRELNALGEPMQAERKGSTSLFAGWFFDQGTLAPGAGSGSGRWEEVGEPEEEGAERPKRIVEWSLQPGLPATVSAVIEGCADLPVGRTATLRARTSPTGGAYRWTAAGDAAVLSDAGGAATLSCEAPGHVTVRLAYQAPDGTTREASREATCFALKGFGGGAQPLEVPIHDEVGNGVPPAALKLDLAPPDAVDAIRFEVAHPPLASAAARTGHLDVQGVREGTTSIVARTCAWESAPLPVKVVPCAGEVLERLRWEQELARRRAATAGGRMAEALAGKDFMTASGRIDKDVLEAQQALEDVLVSTLLAAGGSALAKEVYEVHGALKEAVEAVGAAVQGDFSKGGEMGAKAILGELGKRSARLETFLGAKDLTEKMGKAMDAANQLAGDLGALYGAAEESEQAGEDKSRAEAEILRLGAKLRRCRAEPEPAKRDPTASKPSPKEPRPPQGRRPGGEDLPPASGEGADPAPPPTPPGERRGADPAPAPVPGVQAQGEPPEGPRPPPPAPPVKEFRPGLPIGCKCPERRTVTWTIGGRRLEVGTVELGGTLGCAQDLSSSVANAGEAVTALSSAVEGLGGLKGKPLEAQRDALQAAGALLERGGTGLEAFGKEADGLGDRLGACRKPLGEVGATLRKTAEAAGVPAPPP